MQLDDTSKKVFRYPNAIKRKFDNKQVILVKLEDGTYQLEAVNFDKEFANEPAVCHKTEKGVIRISAFRMSKETLRAFVINAIELLNMDAVV
jgi:DNA polymerase III alpha subunit